MNPHSRRAFLKTTALAGGSTLLLSGTRSSGRVLGANDRLRLAVVGLHGRGKDHLKGYLALPNVEIACLVDPDSNVLEQSKKALLEKTGGRSDIRCVADIRKALDDPNIDAVSIATPNHWHSLMTIWAAQAGKHVYVEKPMSHDIAEGRVAVAAQEKYGVVVQHGTQRRSEAAEAGLAAAIKAGKWGRLKIACGYCCKPRGPIGRKPIAPPPAHLDWNLWKGPAVIDGYHDNFVHYNWHWFWQTGNGDLNNQGTHELDIARWAIDDDQTHPVRAMAIGGRFLWDDQGETPNTLFASAQYPNGQWCFFHVRNVNYQGYRRQVGNEYYFEDGGRIVGGKFFAKGSDKGEPLNVEKGEVTPGGPFGSFVAACRAGDPRMSNAKARDAHASCVLGHLMNDSYRLGKQAPFDRKAGSFGDNKDAAEHFGQLHEIMEKGVGIPVDKANYTVGPWLTFDPAGERFTGEHAGEANALLKDAKNPGFEVPDAAKV